MSTTRLSEWIRVVLAPNPSMMTLEGTNSYIVGNAENVIVIDPGPSDDTHLQALKDEVGSANVVGIFLTHWHHDHSEAALQASKLLDAPIGSWSPLGDERAGIRLHDGENAGANGVTLTAIHTPGHSSDHLCFWLEQERALFTGDLILGRGTSVVAYPDGDMIAYLKSIKRVRDIHSKTLYPGHGPVLRDPATVVQEYLDHRMMRERQVIDALPGTPMELVEKIYIDVDPKLHPIAMMSVRAHLDKLLHDGTAAVDGNDRWEHT
ncbi:MAG: MBL fold metallo-hydrolase [Actinomycetota bacterium]